MVSPHALQFEEIFQTISSCATQNIECSEQDGVYGTAKHTEINGDGGAAGGVENISGSDIKEGSYSREVHAGEQRTAERRIAGVERNIPVRGSAAILRARVGFRVNEELDIVEWLAELKQNEFQPTAVVDLMMGASAFSVARDS
jgi:hypothetical protein